MATPVPAFHASAEPYRKEELDNPARSVGHIFRDRVAQTPDDVAFLAPQGDDEPWRSLTWREVGEDVFVLAAGRFLAAQGFAGFAGQGHSVHALIYHVL